MYQNKKILGVITARLGSKRLVNKNTINLHGKPLFIWTVEEALKSKYLDKIIISTDDNTIINFSKKIKNIKVIRRSKKLSKDETKSEDVILDLISKIKTKFNIICVLQPTSPLRKKYDIDKSLKMMINSKSKSVVSANYDSDLCKHPIKVKNNFFKGFKNNKSKNGYSINGAIYATDVDYFRKNKTFFGKKTKIYFMPKSRSIDIDTIKDFLKAQSLLKK